MTPAGERPASEHLLAGTDVLAGGLRVYVSAHGAGPGLPVLALHGVGTSGRLWQAVAHDLGRGRRVFAPDLPGPGRSEKPRPPGDPAAYRLDSTAARLPALLDALGVRTAAVAGHGVGAALAVLLAAAAPERAAALVLIDGPPDPATWPPPEVRPLLLPGAGPALAALARLAPARTGVLLRRLLPDTGPAPPLRPDGARALVRVLTALDLAPAEQALALLAPPPPTLLLRGERDRREPAGRADRLAAALDAELVTVPGAGHLLPEERPERVAEEIAAFLAELPAQPADQ